MNELLEAIVKDDLGVARKLLQRNRELATCLIRTQKLYDCGIFHWIYEGDTALHLAAAGYRVGIVELLLQAGADPNVARNRRKSSPLHYAADGFITGPDWDAKRQVETIRCLLRAGGNLHLQDMNGATPLHRAVRTRCAAAVKLLLESGSDPTLENKSGSTAFHLAVQTTGRGGSGDPAAHDAQREIIRTFLSWGVDPDRRSSTGKSVKESAQSALVREALAGAGH